MIDALARQLDLEQAACEAGRERFLRNLRKATEGERGDETAAGVAVMRRLLEPVAKGIERWVADSLAGCAGRRATAAVALEDVDPYLSAYIALTNMFGAIAVYKTRRFSSLARAIAVTLEHERRMAAFEDQKPELYRTLMGRLADRGATPQHIERVAVYASGKYGVDWEGWTPAQMAHIGAALIDVTMAETGLFELIHPLAARNRRPAVISAKPELTAWLSDRNDKLSILRPVLMPMVVAPRPWNGLFGGGYRSDAIMKAPIVKRMSKGHRTTLEAADLSKVTGGLNAIQGTAWRINTRVLDVARELWKRGDDMPGLPPKEDRPIPPKSWGEGEEPAEDVLKDWKRRARDTHELNIASRSMRLLTIQQLEAAEAMRDDAALYFPHNLDFRGRCYARPQALNPQGNDLCRGLLTFAERKPLDGAAMRWLAIHGANCFGVDKVSHGGRVAWVGWHAVDIERCAEDPLTETFWRQADAPWAFLAFCIEWRAAQRGEPSSLPIAMDGTCNGLQHYSAMLLDPVGGAAVNLIRADTPQDIYGRVAERVTEKLRAIAASDDPKAWVAQSWADFGIDRKITKRQVMVLPYGGTRNSCVTYTRQAITEKVAGGAENPFGTELVRETAWLAGIIWDSIGEVVVAARRAMDWLREVAKLASAAGVPLAWTTPSGFSAHQDYRTTKERRIKTRLNGTFVYISHNEETDKLDKARQALGLPPNFVHSLDAAAMMLTIERASARGVTQLAMIHDSYGTVAADTQALAECLREAFVGMYSGNILADFRDEIAASLPPELVERLPPLPARGSLDINCVLDSPFFFT